MRIAVIDYGAGNLFSLCNALKKLGQNFQVINRPEGLTRFDKVIFPGVGAAGAAMQCLLENGFIEAIPELDIPFLGICLGMQLLAEFSEENSTSCLFVIPGRVKKIACDLKVPQIGWNKVKIIKPAPLTADIPDESYFYFVHSYYFDTPEKFVLGKSLYGTPYPSIIQKDNFYATQFHPEKSGEIGLQLLSNFCEKC